MAAGAGVLAVVLIVLGIMFSHAQAQTAHLESADCPADREPRQRRVQRQRGMRV